MSEESKLHFFKVTGKVRAAVFEVWQHNCAYCEIGKAEQVDHIIPRAKGGLDVLENYAASCTCCNRRKGDLILGAGIIEITRQRAIRKAPAIAKKLAIEALEKRPNSSASKSSRIVRQDRMSLAFVDMSPLARRETLKHLSTAQKFNDASEPNWLTQSNRMIACVGRQENNTFVNWFWGVGCDSVRINGEVNRSGFVYEMILDATTLRIIFHPLFVEIIEVAERIRTQCFHYSSYQKNSSLLETPCRSAQPREFLPEALRRLSQWTKHHDISDSGDVMVTWSRLTCSCPRVDHLLVDGQPSDT